MKYLALLTALLLPLSLQSQETVQPEDTFDIAAVRTASAKNYMVVAANPMAAEAGRAVLAAGGTAADAGIAVQLMLGLVEPQSSGLGGGAFALYWDAALQKLTSYDGRETAPASATPEYWFGPDGAPIGWRDAVPGGKSVGVPGTPALLQHLHDKHGQLDRATLTKDAIKAATDGFTVSPRLASSIATGVERGLGLFAPTADYFLPGGTPLAAGDTLKNPVLAATMQVFAEKGAAPFYDATLGTSLVDTVASASINPGMMTMTDLADYAVKERAPVCHPYRDYEVCGMGPPSSGALTVGQILMMLQEFDLGTAPNETAWRRYVEASRLAYADRGLYMADSDFVDMPEGLLDARYMKDRAALISAETKSEAPPGTPPWKEGALRAADMDDERPGTTHFVIRDAAGNVLSMTSTIETGFGSRLMANGYLLNNELTDFSRTPERDGKPVANRVEGGKRPRSSMAPTIVLKDGKPFMALGSPGGSRIIGYVANTLIAMIDWGMTPGQAVSMGHVTSSGDKVDLEMGTDAADLEANMSAFGLEVGIRDLNSGLSVMAIRDDGLTGAADPRREGVALGE